MLIHDTNAHSFIIFQNYLMWSCCFVCNTTGTNYQEIPILVKCCNKNCNPIQELKWTCIQCSGKLTKKYKSYNKSLNKTLDLFFYKGLTGIVKLYLGPISHAIDRFKCDTCQKHQCELHFGICDECSCKQFELIKQYSTTFLYGKNSAKLLNF